MRKFINVISFSLVFTLLLTTINITFLNGKVAAETNNDYTEKEVEELANVLETLFEKGVIYDGEGSQVGYNKEVIVEELSGTEYSDFIDEMEEQNLLFSSDNENYFTYEELENKFDSSKLRAASKSKRDAYLDKCLAGKLSDSFGLGAATAVVETIRQGSFKKAAKLLIKAGVKSGGLPITLGWMLSTCIISADKKGL